MSKAELYGGCVIPRMEDKTRHGFIVSFDFDKELEDIYSKVNKALESTPYKLLPFNMLHSTISVSKSNSVKKDLSTISKICADSKSNLNLIRFKFKEILYNADSVILAGYPNDNYWNFCETIVKELNRQTSMEFRLPKMAHITLARISNQKEVKLGRNSIVNLNENFSSIALPIELIPKGIHIGVFEHSQEGFVFNAISNS